MAIEDIFIGGAIARLIALGILVIIALVVALYVYTSLAWYTLSKKLKNKNAWIAWIPIVNGALILQLGRFHWVDIFNLNPHFGMDCTGNYINHCYMENL